MSRLLAFLLFLTTALTAVAQLRIPNSSSTDTGSHWKDASEDTVKKTDIPVGLYVWRIDPRFGTVREAEPDTLPHLFPNTASTGGVRSHYSFTGNLGSPRQSRIFADRVTSEFSDPFIFSAPYDFFITQPDALLFTNTKSPITNITYHECGNKQNGEDRITGIFATNVNKRVGLGFKLDYLYGRGYYDSQSTAHFNGTLWGSYRGERYQLHALYSANHLKNTENGGIEEDDYVLRPESFPTTYGTSDMPTRLTSTWNKLYANTFYLTHRYSLGFHRYRDKEGHVVHTQQLSVKNKLLAGAIGGDSIQAQGQSHTGNVLTADSIKGPDGLTADTLASSAHTLLPNVKPYAPQPQAAPDSTDLAGLTPEFVPVAGFIHTLRIDNNKRQFLSNLSSGDDYFQDFYLPGDSANDQSKNFHVQNLLALELREGFNRWVKSGLRLYARHDYYHYTLPDENRAETSYNENFFTLGGQLLKEQGHFFHYNVFGELRTSGTDWGEFNVAGNADFNIPISRRKAAVADSLITKNSSLITNADTLRIALFGSVRNETPSFYYRHYHARNAWWDNDGLDKMFSANVRAELSYRRTRLAVNLASLQNYTYFQEQQTPYTNSDEVVLSRYGVGVAQASSNIQVLAVSLRQDFKLGILNWENEVTYQLSSDKDALPLPTLSAYSNLYLLFRIAKVLRTEIGADVRYFTEYYAPNYSPIIGQYVAQDQSERIKVGNYPVVNVYANFHLKNTRFYLMASHVNYSSGTGNPFILPHYPLNRMVIRFGISWNFFN